MEELKIKLKALLIFTENKHVQIEVSTKNPYFFKDQFKTQKLRNVKKKKNPLSIS